MSIHDLYAAAELCQRSGYLMTQSNRLLWSITRNANYSHFGGNSTGSVGYELRFSGVITRIAWGLSARISGGRLAQ
jgi:hypothetical protein